jgi:ABC-type microcin C transport system duplicated ATPase subunit YejF
MTAAPVLSVRKLNVALRHGRDYATVVDAVSFDLYAGEVLALVGESGCGKTKTAEALLGLVPAAVGHVRAERLMLGGTDLAVLPESALRQVRGRDLSMVFQEPLTALDPVFRAGQQLTAVLRRHRGLNRRQARQAAVDMLERVGFADAEHVLRS